MLHTGTAKFIFKSEKKINIQINIKNANVINRNRMILFINTFTSFFLWL